MMNIQSMICRVTDMYVSWKTEGGEEWEGKWHSGQYCTE